MSQYRGYFVPMEVDPTGRNCEVKDACGPDATVAFTRYLAGISPALRDIPSDEYGPKDGFDWLWDHGSSIDFYFKSDGYPECGVGKCQKSALLCGSCVRETTPNNILFGIVSAAHGVPKIISYTGANAVNVWTNGWLEGDEQQYAYSMGYEIWHKLLKNKKLVHNKKAICKLINGHDLGFGMSHVGKKFRDCEPCGKRAVLTDFKRWFTPKLPPYLPDDFFPGGRPKNF